MITAAFLTRKLGPQDYGLYTVAVTVVVLVEISITLGFNRTAVKFVSESSQWESVASSLLKAQLLVSILAAIALLAAAPILGSWLNSPDLSKYLALFSLDIPLSALAGIHRSILIGREFFGLRAILTGTYWVVRMTLIILFVTLQPTITAAVLACIGTSAFLLGVARIFIRPSLFKRSRFPIRKLWDYAWPLFFFTIGMHLLNRVDLLFVKAWGGAPANAGFYGAAQNLAIVPVLFTASFTPLLLAKLSRFFAQDQEESAKIMIGESVRMIICMLPFAGMSAGAANELAVAIYGRSFLPSGPLLALLIFAALGIMLISVSSAALIASGRPSWPAFLTMPLVILALAAHSMVVPRFGPMGAAAVTTVLAWCGGLATVIVHYKLWELPLPAISVLRSIFIGAIAYVLAGFWPTPGYFLFIKIPVLSLLIFLAFFSTGELNANDLAIVRTLLPRGKSTEPKS